MSESSKFYSVSVEKPDMQVYHNSNYSFDDIRFLLKKHIEIEKNGGGGFSGVLRRVLLLACDAK